MIRPCSASHPHQGIDPMSTQVTEVRLSSPPKPAAAAVHWQFVWAWLFVCVFYFLQYALRSAPGVMMPELISAFGLTALGVSSLLGLYFYTYSVFGPRCWRVARPLWRQASDRDRGLLRRGGQCPVRACLDRLGRGRTVAARSGIGFCVHGRGLSRRARVLRPLARDSSRIHAAVRHAWSASPGSSGSIRSCTG